MDIKTVFFLLWIWISHASVWLLLQNNIYSHEISSSDISIFSTLVVWHIVKIFFFIHWLWKNITWSSCYAIVFSLNIFEGLGFYFVWRIFFWNFRFHEIFYPHIKYFIHTLSMLLQSNGVKDYFQSCKNLPWIPVNSSLMHKNGNLVILG